MIKLSKCTLMCLANNFAQRKDVRAEIIFKNRKHLSAELQIMITFRLLTPAPCRIFFPEIQNQRLVSTCAGSTLYTRKRAVFTSSACSSWQARVKRSQKLSVSLVSPSSSRSTPAHKRLGSTGKKKLLHT